MKKLFISVVSLILILAVTPLIVGIYLQKHYQPTLAALMESNNMNFKLRSYQRGWFCSEATWITNLPLVDKPLKQVVNNPDDALTIRQKIYQGPLIINSQGIKVALLEITSHYNQTFLAKSSLTFLGHLKTKIAIPSLTIPKQSAAPIYSITGAYGDLDWNLKNDRLRAGLKLQHLSAKIDRPRTIDNFSVQFNLVKTQGGLWVGKRQYQFGQMTWEQDSKDYLINHLNFDIIGTVTNNDRYNLAIIGKVANLGINGSNYGSQKIVISLNGLNLLAVEQFHTQFPLTSMHLLNPYDWQTAKEKFLAILHHGGEIKLDSLQLNTAWGDMIASARYRSAMMANASHEILQEATINAKIPSDLFNQLLTGVYQLKLRTSDENVISNEVARALVSWQQQGWLMVSNNQALISYQWQTKEK
jgi:uncharacterized protein YdgA (DUF945 family)